MALVWHVLEWKFDFKYIIKRTQLLFSFCLKDKHIFIVIMRSEPAQYVYAAQNVTCWRIVWLESVLNDSVDTGVFYKGQGQRSTSTKTFVLLKPKCVSENLTDCCVFGHDTNLVSHVSYSSAISVRVCDNKIEKHYSADHLPFDTYLTADYLYRT